jgi:hypothetical protein
MELVPRERPGGRVDGYCEAFDVLKTMGLIPGEEVYRYGWPDGLTGDELSKAIDDWLHYEKTNIYYKRAVAYYNWDTNNMMMARTYWKEVYEEEYLDELMAPFRPDAHELREKFRRLRKNSMVGWKRAHIDGEYFEREFIENRLESCIYDE